MNTKSAEIEEFARVLVRSVRDAAIRDCDTRTAATSHTVVAERWRSTGASPDAIRGLAPDMVDAAVFRLLQAIDDGQLRLQYTSSTGRTVDLCEEGLGELAGWYMGSGGWRFLFSAERFVDDFADLTEA